jgi:hypothetical protein
MEQTIRFVGAHYLPVFTLQGANRVIPADRLSRSADDYVAHIGGLVPAKLAESSRPEAARASTSFTP